MKIIAVYDRETNERLYLNRRKDILYKVYSPVSYYYNLCSKKLQRLIEIYKDKPLVPYKLTDEDKRRLKRNPDYINDIPAWTIEGYDKEVSASKYNLDITNEFITRFLQADEELVDFINENNDEVKVEIIEE